jgi:hypothetical protein
MDRRSAIKCFIGLPLAFLPGQAKAEKNWVLLGGRTIGSNIRSVSFAVESRGGNMSTLGLEVTGNAIWLYELTVIDYCGKANTIPFNRNLPPATAVWPTRITFKHDVGRTRKLLLNIECLPLTGKATKIWFWGVLDTV